MKIKVCGSVVEWLKRRVYDQHGLGSKATRAILLYPAKDTLRHFPLLDGLGKQFYISFISLFNFKHVDGNILASPEAGRANCLPYVLAPPSLSSKPRG